MTVHALHRFRATCVAFRLIEAVVLIAAARAQGQTVHVTGYVRRADSREVIRYALVSTDGDSIQTRSNADGVYFLTLVPGRHRIRARALGFAPFDTAMTLTTSVGLDMLLSPVARTLAATNVVETHESTDIDPRSTDMSVARLDLPALRKTAALLGEVDPLRGLSLMPGVSRTTDFSTAFNVRGGSGDQNLILLDQATVYNPSHVLGFLSVFNDDAVDDVTLYKGAIPAMYGGRLSSVLDVRQREGSANGYDGTASLGLLSSRASVEGPFPDHLGSFLVAGRRSYADLFLELSPDTAVRRRQAYFYDLNAKTNFPLGASGSLMVSGYLGRDVFSPSGAFGANWGNLSGTVRWNEVVANRLFSKVTLVGSDYDYHVKFLLASSSETWTSRVRSHALRVDETLNLAANQTIDFGVALTNEVVNPGDVTPSDTTHVEPVSLQQRSGLTPAAYVDHEVDLGGRWALRYGARLSTFARRGPAAIYQYAGGAPIQWNPALLRYEPSPIVDSTMYPGGTTVVSYSALEPRASARFALTSTSSLKLSYARTAQYLLLASRTSAATPLDVWEPVGPYLKPERADQWALGWSADVADRKYALSAETYTKRMSNVPDFIDGADVVLNPRLETALVQGIGRAAGLELLARKSTGATTGWVSYTLSRAEQRYEAAPGQGINGGAWYPSPWSKTHDLSVVAVHRLSPRWTLGATFVASSGLPTTVPESRYEIDGRVVAEYGPRNAQRLPMYHRLDLAFTRATAHGEFEIGAYNVYNHFNAQTLSFQPSSSDPRLTEAVETSIFGIVPSISYTRHF